MNITKQATDAVILAELGRRLAQARLDRNLTQGQLATEAGVSQRTIQRLETGAVATQLSGFIRVCRTLDLLDRFDLLIPEPAPSPVAQLKLGRNRRQRASRSQAKATPGTQWQWGDE
jgi:transcriptional regulator with XRE-family HTH domain